MNNEWSELNKQMQGQLKKESFSEGINTLLLLRRRLFEQITSLREEMSNEELCMAPFLGAKGFHSKTILYSIWHITRIEDIVSHTLILQDEEIFFRDNYTTRMKTPIITTGNELKKQEIVEFSHKLNVDELFTYCTAVYESTNQLLQSLTFEDLKRKMTEEEKERVRELKVVSEDPDAIWLIDYWCTKSIKGLLKMPFSRHWIMHIEAIQRIKKRLIDMRKTK